MVIFENVTKVFKTGRVRNVVLQDVSFAIPREKNVAILGRNGAGKSTVISLMAGSLAPNEGKVMCSGRTSWTLAYAGAFHPLLTGRQNAAFVARIYGLDRRKLESEVEEFSELSDAYELPMRTYSQGMRARLAFSVSMAVNFDRYLVDEIIGVGDARFRNKCRQAFREKLSDAQVVMATHSEAGIREYCQAALLVENGSATFFEDLEEGLNAYSKVLETAPPDVGV